MPSSHARSAHSRNRSARNASSNDKLNAGMPTSTGSPVASKAAAETEDSVLCRSVEEKRTPLINLEGGRQISYVRCSCSKCQGLVMCGDKQLLPTAVTPSHYDLHLTPNLETFAYDGEMTVKLTVQNRQAKVSVVPSASALVIKALKEPPRDRKKVKHIKHSGNISKERLFFVAREMRHKSMAKEFVGTVKEMLGTAVSLGCTIDGQN